MREEKRIIIDIDAEGNCSIEGKGFVGPECGEFIEEVESVLGTRVSQHDTEEYHERNTSRGSERELEGR